MINEISFIKTARGTEKTCTNGDKILRSFKFLKNDVGKYIVIKFRYEQHMFWGSPFGTGLQVNNHVLTTNGDYLYGVYLIDYYNDYARYKQDLSYKVALKPVGNFGAWCPDRAWYTSDMESHINMEYNLFEENPVFDTEEEAVEFAVKKNEELY